MTKFSSDEKVQAAMRYEKGLESLKSIAKSIGIHHSVFQTGLNNMRIMVKKLL